MPLSLYGSSQIARTIAVVAGNGGVGNSIIAVHLASELALKDAHTVEVKENTGLICSALVIKQNYPYAKCVHSKFLEEGHDVVRFVFSSSCSYPFSLWSKLGVSRL